MNATSLDKCSFCGKHKDQVDKLIVSYQVAICDQCVDLCEGLLVKKSRRRATERNYDPRAIHNELNRWVIGQDEAKITLSVAIANHYKRIESDEPTLRKSNILMVGPTGTGKTLLTQRAAQFLDVPYVVADCTSLTEAGYVGDDVDVVISRLLMAANGDVQRAQRGIVFLDEVDKIAKRGESATVSRDVSGEGVQQSLLRLVEGTQAFVSATNRRSSSSNDTVMVDTTNILFVAGGAFVGIDNIIKTRTAGSTIGFGAQFDKPVVEETISPEDLIGYGMIPEFIGRFTTIVGLSTLTQSQLKSIMCDVDDSLLTQYKKLFARDGIDLVLEDSVIDAIADRAWVTKTGARALHRELERVLLPHMYDINGYKEHGIDSVVIDQKLMEKPCSLIQKTT